ncbi:MAG: aldose 1-epimerase family protein [Ruminococcaceae bacterium]|nr:aldose 1-epimerase family protein [Oscillospiraceae bacterium]
MVTIKNEFLTVDINKIGAELKKIEYNSIQYLWQGRDEVWSYSAPLLFPICGGLKEDKYLLNGKEYFLEKHGFARKTVFEVESISENKVTFLHKSNEETKVKFPFDYELRVIYTLDGKSLKVDYNVINKSNEAMYFSIGSHEGYYTPEGIEDYDIVFPQNETLNAYVLYGELLSNQPLPIIKDSNVLPLYDKYFTVDALVFKDLKSKSATLRNRKTGRAVRVDFPDDKYFLLWHKPNAPFICLEPWDGVQDIVGTSYDISEKVGIVSLSSGKEYNHTHSITIVE